MRSLSNHSRLRIENRAGKIEALTDIRAKAGTLERDTHLFGNAGEKMFENFQGYGIRRHDKALSIRLLNQNGNHG
jgi:hypothetical protein